MHIAVVGAGVFGAWSACRLAQAGHTVTLIDAYGAANGRASSADVSRVIRSGYGADAIYSRWAAESMRDWKWLGEATGQTLVTITGALFLGEPGNQYVQRSRDTLAGLDLAVDWLETEDLARRYPQLSLDGLGPALLERDAGVIRARAAVQALMGLNTTALRVHYRVARVAPLDESLAAATLTTDDGAVVDADAFVLAGGPWLPQLLPQAVGTRIRPTRQEVLHFGVPPGDLRFSVPQLPVWIDFGAGLYGIPDIDAHGFKVGVDRHGPAFDPDSSDRVVDAALVDTIRAWLATRFPGLAGAPLVDSRVCQYENTSNGDFLIDRHPAWDNVWIVGGGSGHGFKHGPAVGRHVAALVAGNSPVETRFRLSRVAEAERKVF